MRKRLRVSAPLVVSFLALFVALGGAGWAALRLPPNSVGSAQLRANSVGTSKIVSGAVGARQVNSSQVQLRVTSSCLIGAVQSFTVSGNVTCTPALPSEYGTLPQSGTLGAANQQVAAVSLPTTQQGSSYLAVGNVQVSEVGGTTTQSVDVACSMSPAGGSGTVGHLDTNLGGSNPRTASETIPLVLPVSIAASPQTLAISCSALASPATPPPSVTVIATIHAVQTAGNNDS
jgi:hypothetical protein